MAGVPQLDFVEPTPPDGGRDDIRSNFQRGDRPIDKVSFAAFETALAGQIEQRGTPRHLPDSRRRL